MLSFLYRHSPYPLRVLAASLHGYRLQSQRYGAQTDEEVAQILARDAWTPAQWLAWQTEQLGSLLERAATRVPFYRAVWAQRRRKGDRADWSLLENWPVLDKQDLRANPRAFLADDVDPRALIEEHTSGTSGTPLLLWRSRETQRRWYGLFEARVRRWNGLSRQDRWAILGGQW